LSDVVGHGLLHQQREEKIKDRPAFYPGQTIAEWLLYYRLLTQKISNMTTNQLVFKDGKFLAFIS